MRCLVIIFAVTLALLAGPDVGSAGQAFPGAQAAASGQASGGDRSKTSDARVVELDSNLVFAPLDGGSVLARRFEENTARPLSSYLSVSADRIYGMELYELSKAECALVGADTGLTLGLIAGALGMTAGLWDEKTAWYLAGAAAALGAFRGLSKADEPAFRVRLRWEETNQSPASR